MIINLNSTASANQCLKKILSTVKSSQKNLSPEAKELRKVSVKDNVLKVYSKQYENALLRSKTQDYKKMQKEIAVAYKNFSSDAPRINFEKNLELILKDLNEVDSKAIKEIVDNKTIVFNEFPNDNGKFEFAGFFVERQKRIEILLPEEFKGTDLEYYLKMHEVTHAITNLLGNKSMNKDSVKKISTFLGKVERRYLDESAAMAQEWNYLNSIPKESKIKLLKEIDNFGSFDKHYSDMLKRVFNSNNNSALQHVLSERATGRYSKNLFLKQFGKEFAAKYARKGILGYGPTTIKYLGGLAISYVTVGLICKSIDLDRIKDTAFNKYFCSRHKFIKD